MRPGFPARLRGLPGSRTKHLRDGRVDDDVWLAARGGAIRQSALDRFESDFQRWVSAYNEAHPHIADATTLLGSLRERIGDHRLSQIGSALLNGWLETESGDGRGYFVRESDRGGERGGQFVFIHQGGGRVAPCWELYIQLADYAWLRTVAERHGHTVRLEDDLMDLTVRAGEELVVYIEQKTDASTAAKLVKEMKTYGRSGFSLDDPDVGNDPLRKAKYLVRPNSRPNFFGVSAIGHQQLFRVEYGAENRFNLIEDHRPLSAPLADHSTGLQETPKPRSPVDPLAIEVQRLCPEIWISVGSGKTVYNFYYPTDNGDAVVLGVYETGEIWSDLAALGEARATRLRRELSDMGVTLAEAKQWTFWRTGKTRMNLMNADPVRIAEAVRNSLD